MMAKKASEEISRKLNDDNKFSRAEAAHHKLNEQEVGKLLTDAEKSVRLVAVKFQELTPNQMSAVLTLEKESEIRKTMIRYQKLQEKHLDIAVKDSAAEVVIAAVMYHKLNRSQAEAAMEHKESDVRSAVMAHQKDLPEDLVSRGIADQSISVKLAAMEHQKLTEKQVDSALSESNPHIRRQAVIHQELNESQVYKALSDSDRYVREAAKEQKHLKVHLFKRLFHKHD